MSRKTDFGGLIFLVAILLMGAVALAAQIDGIGKNPGNGNGQGQGGGERHDKKRIVHGKVKDKRAIDLLMDDSDGDVEVEMGKENVLEVHGRFKIDKNKPVDEAVVDFIDRHRNAFGLKNPKAELKLIRKEGTLRFQQTYNGIPIVGTETLVHVNKDHELDDFSSSLVPTPDIDTTPLISKEEAISIAKDYSVSIWPSSKTVSHPRFPTVLVIENNILVYIVPLLVKSRWWEIHVDAKTGKAIRKIDKTRDFTANDLPTNGVAGDGSIIPIMVHSYNGRYYLAHSFPSITGIAISNSLFEMNNNGLSLKRLNNPPSIKQELNPSIMSLSSYIGHLWFDTWV